MVQVPPHLLGTWTKGSLSLCWRRPPDPTTPQRCCPARGVLQAISESVETQPLLRLSLAILTIGSLLSVAIVNLVSSGGWWGQRALGRSLPACVCFLRGESQSLTLGTFRLSNPTVPCLRAMSGIALQDPGGRLPKAPRGPPGLLPFCFSHEDPGPPGS